MGTWKTIHRCIFICIGLASFADALLVIRGSSEGRVGPSPWAKEAGLPGARKAPPLLPRAGSSGFKILQLADLHLGEDFDGEWGPEQDRKTMAVVETLLDNEKPDLVVFSGDQLTGEGLGENASRREMLLNKLEEPLKRRGVPWATIFGNHDACKTPGCRETTDDSRNILLLSGKHEAPTQEEVDAAHTDLAESMKKEMTDIVVRLKDPPSLAAGPAAAPAASPAAGPPPPAAGPPPPVAVAAGPAAPTVAATPPVVAAAPAAEASVVASNDEFPVFHALRPNILFLSGKHEAPTQEEVNAAHTDLAESMKKEMTDIVVRLKDPPSLAAGPAAAPAASPAAGPPPPAAGLPPPIAVAAPTVAATPAAAPPVVASAPAAEEATVVASNDQFPVFHALRPKRAVQNLGTPGTGAAFRSKYLQHEFASSLSRTGIEGIFESSGGGKSNYCLKVFASNDDAKADQPSFLLWFVDSGGGGSSEGLQADELDWLSKESAAMERKYGPLPGALYAHIPSQEFTQVNPGQQGASCNGVSDDAVTPAGAGTHLFPLLSKMHISWVFSGHNHGNDWCCRVGVASAGNGLKQPDIELCYGRHSGYGGYSTPGLHLRGARVFELHPAMAKRFLRGHAGESGMESWVRLEDGTKGPHWSEKP